ncbi:MAG: type II secretion system protein [Dehalococcoidales bacterium]|nr:MAG: type II secretion system protein [Dehalococcoidales bacterium]
MKATAKQRGMTLVEILLALGISGVIIGALGASIYTIMSVTGRGNAEISVLRDIQSASHWISNDSRMARDVTLIGGVPANGMVLSWNDSQGNPHSSNYTHTEQGLIRSFNGTSSIIAWNVSSVDFSLNDDVLTYTLTSETEGRWVVNKEVTGYVNLRSWEEN